MSTQREHRLLRMLDKDLRKALQTAGCSFKWTGSNHIRILYEGRTVSVFGCTPSDRRASLNLYSQLRRNGVPI